jgi:hypothetical protein
VQDNGLKLANKWRGKAYVNPPFTSYEQWQFVNRAIDEVENEQVLQRKGMLLESRHLLSPVTSWPGKHFLNLPLNMNLCISSNVYAQHVPTGALKNRHAEAAKILQSS